MQSISRSDSLAVELTARLKSLVHKRSGMALALWGSPGIGKTFMVKGLLREGPCRSYSLHATARVADWVRVLPRPKLPAWSEHLLHKQIQGHHAEADKVADALGALLAGLAPVVLHLEDIHEATPEQLELIQALALRVGRIKGVALLATSRVAPPEGFDPYAVRPLDGEASKVLLEGEIGAMLPEEALEWIYFRALGNPLFSLEYLRHLTRQGYLWNNGSYWRWREPHGGLMPVSVEALIEHTLREAMQTPLLAQALGAKALLGLHSSEKLWALVAQLSSEMLHQAKATLNNRCILQGSEFVHPLYREIALRMLGSPERRALARRAIQMLWNDPQSAAAFVEEAHLLPDESLRLLEQAAGQATLAGNPVQASRFLGQATQYAHGKTLGRLAFEAAQGLRHIHLKEAVGLAELASSVAEYQSRAIFLLAELKAIQGQGQEAEQILSRLPEAEREGIPYQARRVQLRSAAQDHKGALELVRQYPDLLHSPDPQTAYRAGWTLVSSGFLDEAEQVAQKALSQANLPPDSQAVLLKVLSMVGYFRGDYAQMEGYEFQILQIATQIGNLRLKDQALFNRAIALEHLGRFGEQKASLEQAMQTCLELGDTTAYIIAQSAYGGLLSEFGQYQQAQDLLLEARTFLERIDLSGYLADCEFFLGKLYRQWQPQHGKTLALKHANASLKYARRLQSPWGLVQALHGAALAEAWGGSSVQALALAGEALEVATKLGQPNPLLEAHTALAQALLAGGQLKQAMVALRKAQALAQQTGSLIPAQMLGLELDRLTGNLEGARARKRWFEQHQLGSGLDILRHHFPELFEGAGSNQGNQNSPKASCLRLEVLGVVQFCGEAIRGRKRQELLAYLLEARLAQRPEVPKLNLMDALYPESSETQAAAALKEVVHQIRASLGPNVILTTPGGYALGEVESDAELFVQTGDTRLWRGAYLEDLTLAESEASVSELLYQRLYQQGSRLTESDPKEAARVGRILLEVEPYDPKALTLTLKTLRAMSNHKTLSRLYGEAKERFSEVGEQLPISWMEYLNAEVQG